MPPLVPASNRYIPRWDRGFAPAQRVLVIGVASVDYGVSRSQQPRQFIDDGVGDRTRRQHDPYPAWDAQLLDQICHRCSGNCAARAALGHRVRVLVVGNDVVSRPAAASGSCWRPYGPIRSFRFPKRSSPAISSPCRCVSGVRQAAGSAYVFPLYGSRMSARIRSRRLPTCFETVTASARSLVIASSLSLVIASEARQSRWPRRCRPVDGIVVPGNYKLRTREEMGHRASTRLFMPLVGSLPKFSDTVRRPRSFKACRSPRAWASASTPKLRSHPGIAMSDV